VRQDRSRTGRPRRRRQDGLPRRLGLEEPGLNRLIRAGYQLLGLQTYFTAGVKEVRAWTIHVGDTAPQAAGVIHTDFERGFIRAQTIAFDDFIKYKGEAGAKEAGKMRSEGKEYVVKDGDVLNFLFNVYIKLMRAVPFLGGAALCRYVGPYRVHVERHGLFDELFEGICGQRAGLRIDDDLVTKDHQGRDRADAEGGGDFLLFFRIHLGEDDAGLLFRHRLEGRREAAAGRAPGRPEIDDHVGVFIDGLLEIVGVEFQRGHVRLPC
jgi:hypothetical protein